MTKTEPKALRYAPEGFLLVQSAICARQIGMCSKYDESESRPREGQDAKPTDPWKRKIAEP